MRKIAENVTFLTKMSGLDEFGCDIVRRGGVTVQDLVKIRRDLVGISAMPTSVLADMLSAAMARELGEKQPYCAAIEGNVDKELLRRAAKSINVITPSSYQDIDEGECYQTAMGL